MERTIISFYIDLIYNLLAFLTFIKYCNFNMIRKNSQFVYLRNFTIMLIIQIVLSYISTKYFMIVMIAFYIAYNYSTYTATIKKSTYNVIKFHLIYFIPNTLGYIVLTLLIDLTKSLDLLDNHFFQNLKGIISSIVLYVYFSMIYSTKRKNKSMSKNPYAKYIYLLLSLILLVLCFFVFISVNQDTNKETFQNLIVMTFMINIMMIVVIISIYEKIVDFLQESAFEQLKLQKYEMNQNFYNELSEKARQLRSLKHDFKNHLIVMRGRLDRNEYNELSEYLDSITTFVDDAGDVILTNNSTISSMLQAKKSQCKKLKINFVYEIDFNQIYKITDMDLIIILGNILDNAIDAVSKMSTDNRYIRLFIKQVDSYLTIMCQNPYAMKPLENNGQLLTTKTDTNLHGIGLMNVMESCKKYNGECTYTYDDKEFRIEIIIPNY